MATVSSQEKESLCKKCKKDVKENDLAIECDGFCGKWFHLACSRLKKEHYNMIEKLNDVVLWMCEECKIYVNKLIKYEPEELIKSIKNKKEASSMETTIAEKMDIIDEKIEKIKVSLDSLKNFPPKKTYAEVIKNITDDKAKPYSYAEGIVIKPNNKKQKSEVTKTLVQAIIKPKEAKVPITKVNYMKDGGIVIKTSNETNHKKLFEYAKNKLNKDYQVDQTKKKKPRLTIAGLPTNYTTNDLFEEIKALNPNINEEDNLNIVHSKQDKYTSKWKLYFEVNGSLFSKIANRYVNVDWHTYYVKEDLNVLRCYKCQGYHHMATNCNNETVCAKCAENHNTKQCNNNVKKCINCCNKQSGSENSIQTDHSADSYLCPVLQMKLKIQKERTNYE